MNRFSGLEQKFDLSHLVSSLARQMPAQLRVSLDPRLEVGLLSATVWLSQSVTNFLNQAIRMVKGTPAINMTQVHGPSFLVMKNPALLFCLISHVLRISQASVGWLKKVTDVPVESYEIKCKRGSFSARITFSTRATCQHFLVRHKDTDFLNAVDSLFCRTTATSVSNFF